MEFLLGGFPILCLFFNALAKNAAKNTREQAIGEFFPENLIITVEEN